MVLFYVLSFFKKGDIIEGNTVYIKSVNFHAKETPLKRGLKVHNSENDNEYNDSLL